MKISFETSWFLSSNLPIPWIPPAPGTWSPLNSQMSTSYFNQSHSYFQHSLALSEPSSTFIASLSPFCLHPLLYLAKTTSSTNSVNIIPFGPLPLAKLWTLGQFHHLSPFYIKTVDKPWMKAQCCPPMLLSLPLFHFPTQLFKPCSTTDVAVWLWASCED